MSIRFSVIIATSNRPSLAAQAIDSVLAQTYDNLEVIVVNNGSTEESLQIYSQHLTQLKQKYGDKVTLLPDTNTAYPALGPAIARNLGIQQASGNYIGFCDDDDIWIDDGYLEALADTLSRQSPDIVFADQRAVDAAGSVKKASWFSPPVSEAQAAGQLEGHRHPPHPFITTTPAHFYRHGGFPHLNITFYRRDLLSQWGGFRKDLFYEEDMELFLRLSGHSKKVLHYPVVIAEHRIPGVDVTSASNILSDRDKLLTRLDMFSQLALTHHNPGVVQTARRGASFTAKNLTLAYLSLGETGRAMRTAKLALSWDFSLKWLFGSAFLLIKHLLRPSANSTSTQKDTV